MLKYHYSAHSTNNLPSLPFSSYLLFFISISLLWIEAESIDCGACILFVWSILFFLILFFCLFFWIFKKRKKENIKEKKRNKGQRRRPNELVLLTLALHFHYRILFLFISFLLFSFFFVISFLTWFVTDKKPRLMENGVSKLILMIDFDLGCITQSIENDLCWTVRMYQYFIILFLFFLFQTFQAKWNFIIEFTNWGIVTY